MPPTALSLLSPPSIVTLRLRPVEPPTENVPTRALVGSNEGCSVAPGIRIASDANERPFTGRFSNRRWSINSTHVCFGSFHECGAFAGDCDSLADTTDFQIGIRGGPLQHVYYHRFLNVLGEARGLNFQAIVAGHELGDFISTVATRVHSAFGVGSDVHELHCRAGDQAAFLILDYSVTVPVLDVCPNTLADIADDAKSNIARKAEKSHLSE